MTVAAICLHLAESKRMSVNRKMLICGPTNKSVVVLAEKFLQCMGDFDESNQSSSLPWCRPVMIGDKAELLADSPKGLDDLLVYSYLDRAVTSFEKYGKSLAKTKKFWEYNRDTSSLLRQMNEDLTNISLLRIEEQIVRLGDLLSQREDNNEAKHKEKSQKDKDKKKLHKQIQNAIREVNGLVRNLDQQIIVQDLLASANLIFCTLASAGNMPMRRMGHVSTLIVDEASACTEAELLIPMHTRPEKLMLIGDPKQLPATVMSPVAMKFGLSKSLQERLMFNNNFEYTLVSCKSS